MKAVIAIDSFKGSMDSIEAGRAAAAGIKRVFPDAETVIYPLADGGEGTVQALAKGLGGKLEHVKVTGPLGEKVVCEYAIVGKTNPTAIIEMAGAAGITLVPPELRNPMNTTTYGVGEVIEDALTKNCRNFIIGIGGSATNDGGIGMLQALGAEFLDRSGKQVPFGACGVEKLASINCENMLPELKDCNFHIACDVDNPLCGENGCSRIFGPQKGATPELVEQMDVWMARYAQLSRSYNCDPDYPGSGAAGGLGFAFRTFLHGNLEPGINIVLDEIGIESQMKTADVVITGEGRLDGQTVRGKAPIGVARLARKYGKPVLAFSGSVTEDAAACNQAGITAFFPILRQVSTLEDAMKPVNAQKNMCDTVEQVFRLLRLYNFPFSPS
nr:glycerate kinase [uncultured Blautia sp.]